MTKRFEVESVFTAVDHMSSTVTAIQSKISTMTSSIDRSMHRVNRSFSGVSKSLNKLKTTSAVALGTLGLSMSKIIRVGSEFQHTLVSAGAKFPGIIREGTEAFEELEDAARHAGATTQFTANNAAQTLNILATAGFSAKASIAALPKIMDLATVANLDLANASNIATKVLGGFGLRADNVAQQSLNLTRVNDALSKTSIRSATTVAGLFETLKDAAPAAKLVGASLESTLALAAALGNTPIAGTSAGTAIKNIFIQMSAAADSHSKVARIFRRLHFDSIDEATGKTKDLVTSLGELNEKMSGFGSAKRLSVLTGVFGKISLPSVGVLMEAGTKKLTAFRDALKQAAGTSQTLSAVMRDDVHGSLLSLSSAIESVEVNAFIFSKGPLRLIIDQMRNWVLANNKLIASKLKTYLKFISDNLGSIVTALKSLAAAIGIVVGLKVAFFALNVVIAATNVLLESDPIVLFVTASVLAIGFLLHKFGALGAAIKVVLKVASVAFKAFGALVSFVFVKPVKDISALIETLISAPKRIMDAWSSISNFFGNLLKFHGAIAQKPNLAIDIPTGLAPRGGAMFQGDVVNGEHNSLSLAPQIVSPHQSLIRMFSEKSTLNHSEVTIRDKTGRAEVTNGKLGSGISLESTGDF